MQNGSVRIGRTEVCFYVKSKLIIIVINKSFYLTVDQVTSNVMNIVFYFSG